MTQDQERVAVGRMLKPRGIQGEAFLHPLTDHVERFEALKTAECEFPDGRRSEVRIAYVRSYGKRLAIKLEGARTPEDVTAYRGALLTVAREDVHALPDDVFYVFEVEGMPAVTESGEPLGTVREVLTFPASDLYVIDRDGEELLVPAVKEWVEVDREQGRVVVKGAGRLLGSS